MTETQEFNDLLRKIKYDADAREKFCFRYYNLLKMHVFFKYGAFPDWEDVVHDTISKLIAADWTSQAYIKRPLSWLYTVADNIAKDMFKKSSRLSELDERTYSNFSIDFVIIREDLREAIKHLKRDTQYILYAHYWLGKELYSIAQEMHRTYVSVRVEAHRARKILLKYL